jgi:cytoskeletal protein CcmA (bactofilin family)
MRLISSNRRSSKRRPARSFYRYALRRVGLALLGLLICIAGTGVGIVEASDGMRGNECVIQKEEVIDHDFYFICRTLTVRGAVEGDLVGLASKVTLTRDGQVTGDVWVLGGQLTVQSEIGDDIRFVGADLDISDRTRFPNAASDVVAAAISVEISRGAEVPGDVLMVGYQSIVGGDVGGRVDFQGQALVIQGTVGGNVDAIVGDARQESNLGAIQLLPYSISLRRSGLTIGEQAVITGDLNYEAARQANIPRGTVQGKIHYIKVLEQADITRAEQSEALLSVLKSYVVNIIRDTVSLILVGTLALQFTPVLMVEPGRRVRRALVPAATWGLTLFLVSFPIALLFVLFSVLVALGVTIITLGETTLVVIVILFLSTLNVVLIGGFWFLLVFLGRAITCFVIGYSLIQGVRYYLATRNYSPDDPPIIIPPLSRRGRWFALALGVLAISVIVNLPLPSPVPTIELLLQGVVAFAGLGAIFMYGRDVWYMREAAAGRGGWFALGARLGIPPLEDQETPLGMSNLPEGFKGFPD